MDSIQLSLKKHSSKRSLTFLLLSLFISNSVFAQNATTSTGSNAIYYLLFVGLCLLCAAVYIIRKASVVLGEHGQSIFDFDTSAFKNMSENSRDVTIFVVVIVVIGIYLALSYGS